MRERLIKLFFIYFLNKNEYVKKYIVPNCRNIHYYFKIDNKIIQVYNEYKDKPNIDIL